MAPRPWSAGILGREWRKLNRHERGRNCFNAAVQADGQVKNRPALILRQMPGYGDFLVCGVSTQLWQAIPNFDEIISKADDDFPTSGLKESSVIRLGFLAILPNERVLGSIGKISRDRHNRLLQTLSAYLMRIP